MGCEDYLQVSSVTLSYESQAGKLNRLPSLLFSTVRIIDNATLRLALEDCRALKKEFPHRIVGYVPCPRSHLMLTCVKLTASPSLTTPQL